MVGFEPLTFLASIWQFNEHSRSAIRSLCKMLLDTTDIDLFRIKTSFINEKKTYTSKFPIVRRSYVHKLIVKY